MLLFNDQIVIVKRSTDRSLAIAKKGKGKGFYHKTYRFSDAAPIPLTDLTSDALLLKGSG